jgi:hypothetical protein
MTSLQSLAREANLSCRACPLEGNKFQGLQILEKETI